MTNAKELEPNGHSLAEHGAPLVLSTSHPLVAEAEALSGISACEGDGIEASAQASFEKVVYQELGTPFKYRSVAVLIVHWADYLDDDLKCGAEVSIHPPDEEEKANLRRSKNSECCSSSSSASS